MKPIHGIVYLIIGAIVSVTSYFLNYEKLIFFFWLGLVFMAVGVIKLLFGFMRGEAKKPAKKHKHHVHPKQHPQAQSSNPQQQYHNQQRPAQQHRQQQRNPQQVQQRQNPQHNVQGGRRFCANCGGVIYPNNNFCPNCGMRQG